MVNVVKDLVLDSISRVRRRGDEQQAPHNRQPRGHNFARHLVTKRVLPTRRRLFPRFLLCASLTEEHEEQNGRREHERNHDVPEVNVHRHDFMQREKLLPEIRHRQRRHALSRHRQRQQRHLKQNRVHGSELKRRRQAFPPIQIRRARHLGLRAILDEKEVRPHHHRPERVRHPQEQYLPPFIQRHRHPDRRRRPVRVRFIHARIAQRAHQSQFRMDRLAQVDRAVPRRSRRRHRALGRRAVVRHVSQSRSRAPSPSPVTVNLTITVAVGRIRYLYTHTVYGIS